MNLKAQGVRRLLTVLLACLAIGVVVFYSICGGSCSYLKGAVLGIDLTYVGIIYMLVILVLSLLRKDKILLPLLAAGIGVEIFLVGLQVKYDTYCPYCLIFGAVVISLFIINFNLSRKWLAVLGIAVGFAAFLLLFKGQVAPRYSINGPVPAIVGDLMESSWTEIERGSRPS